MRNVILGLMALLLADSVLGQQCALDPNRDRRTSIDELVVAIHESLVGCPGGPVIPSATPTRTPAPTAPHLSNLHGAISGNLALIRACNSLGFTNALTVTADFTGDVIGGTFQVFATFAPSGNTFNEAIAIPSVGVGISGSTMEYRACVTPNQDTSLRIELRVVSPRNVNGNRVSVTFPI